MTQTIKDAIDWFDELRKWDVEDAQSALRDGRQDITDLMYELFMECRFNSPGWEVSKENREAWETLRHSVGDLWALTDDATLRALKKHLDAALGW